jgi:hypothetical protein
MDEPTVRKQLSELRDELARFDDERNVIVNLIRNYETWLRLRGKDVGSGPPVVLRVPTIDATATVRAPTLHAEDAPAAEGGPSFRGSVLKVLKDAHGEPLHAKEILRRVEAAGASTEAKNALSVVALAIRSLSKNQPIVKAGPRTWRWAGQDASIPPAPDWLAVDEGV